MEKSAAERFVPPPYGDLTVVAGKQNVRHAPAAEFWWTGIVRPLEQSRSVRVLCGRRRLPQYARDEACHGVDKDHGGNLPAGQHIISDGNLVGRQMLADALVHAFIVTA